MNKTILKSFYIIRIIFMPIKIFLYEFVSKISLKFIFKNNEVFSFLKIFTTFLLCYELQRQEISLIIKISFICE